MRSVLFAMLVISSVLTGCSLHQPTSVEWASEPPSVYLQSQQESPAPVAIDPWWLAFEDQELNRLMIQLFQQNLELEQAIARLEQVDALTAISRSARYPTLGAAANASRSEQPGLARDFVGDSHQLSLQAAYEIDLWGKLSARSEAAQRDYQATRAELETLYLGLSARLADLYFLAAEQRAQIVLTDQLIASFQDTTERVERRYLNGLAPAIDLYQSRQSLSAARANRHIYEAALAEAEHAISVLLGDYPQQGQSGDLVSLPEPPPLFDLGIPADLMKNRPDLLAALRRIEAADQRVAAAVADRFPSISLSGNYGTLRQEVAAGLIKGEFWTLLGNLALPLVDGGRRRAEVDRTEAVLREAVAAYQQKVLVAFQDVEDALANNYATAQRVDRLAETAASTGASLRLSTERYLAGLTDYLPVLTAQRNDFETRSRFLAAQRQLLADRVSLARALGGTWMQDALNQRLEAEEVATQ